MPGAVPWMVGLLEADLSRVVADAQSEADLRTYIGGLLPEMTGQGFGTDAERWRAWLAR